eukprot:gene9796-biopygen3780
MVHVPPARGHHAAGVVVPAGGVEPDRDRAVVDELLEHRLFPRQPVPAFDIRAAQAPPPPLHFPGGALKCILVNFVNCVNCVNCVN